MRSPGLVLVLLASGVGVTTVRLAGARDTGPAPLAASPGRIAIEHGTAQPLVVVETSSNGVVTSDHPVLPGSFAGLADDILASPMLHHPPFADEVERWVGLWSEAYSDWMPSYLGRMHGFQVIVDTTLASRGLPPSLRYLPVIESGYNPTAVSSAKAVGLWQFMAPTAKDFGIEVGPLVDDRRDPFVSTAAAAAYLEQLNQKYDSWFLALAAYNAGPDRIDGILRKYLPHVEPSDAAYWALREVLPSETAAFVPNFIGAAIVASDPVAHGYDAPVPVDFDFDRVPIRGSISFEAAARAAGTTRNEIERLNPEYVKGVTPPDREVDLRLPAGLGSTFRSYFADGDRPGG